MVGVRPVVETAAHTHELSGCDRPGRFYVREADLRQVVSDRGVEIDPFFVDELHHERGGEDLRRRSDLEERVVRRRDVRLRVLDTDGHGRRRRTVEHCYLGTDDTQAASDVGCVFSENVRIDRQSAPPDVRIGNSHGHFVPVPRKPPPLGRPTPCQRLLPRTQRATATAPLAVYRSKRSTWARRCARTWVLACSANPWILAQRGLYVRGVPLHTPKPEPIRRTYCLAHFPKAIRCLTKATREWGRAGSSSLSRLYPMAMASWPTSKYPNGATWPRPLGLGDAPRSGPSAGRHTTDQTRAAPAGGPLAAAGPGYHAKGR